MGEVLTMWKTVEYKKGQINQAGEKIILDKITKEEKNECLKVINNWRVAHAFPMNTFTINLKKHVKEIDGAIVVQRLKRLDTIIDKLKRFPKMKLFRMQDLGGCRVILPTIDDVYRIKKKFQSSRIRHELHNEKDYIAIPNPNTGYRGIHLIYKYFSDRRDDFNGLQIEIQLRSKKQHLWATAVETVGVFTQNGLKFNQGSDRWLRFFKVVSALFSVDEKSAIVDGVSTDPNEIIDELIALMRELKVTEKLFTIGLATRHIGRIQRSKTPGYYLLVLDISKSTLHVSKFSGIEKATQEYDKAESEKTADMDVVLVSAESFDSLMHAYPNYFANVTEFIDTLFELINKYGEFDENQL